jgi:MFS family permease
MLRSFASLLAKRPHFRRLWLAEVISLLGDWMSFVAVSLLALKGGGGAVSLALVLVAHVIPQAILAPVSGVLADRLDRRRLMIAIAVSEGALTLAMAAAAAAGSVGLVQVIVLVRASVEAFMPPVQSAVMRRVVDEEELLLANAITSGTWSVMFAFGMAAGGAIATLGPVIALLADAASFFGAALALRGLPPLPAPEGAKGSLLSVLASIRGDMAAAWAIARQRSDLLLAVFAKTPLSMAGGAAWILINLAAADVPFAGSAALTLGVLQCVRGTGTGVGPVIAASLVRRGLAEERALRLSTWIQFGGVALFALATHWAVLVIALLAWGMGAGGNWVLSTAAIQRLSPDHAVGRLSAIDGLGWTCGMCLATIAGGVLVDATGSHTSAAWLGLGLGIASHAALHRLVRGRVARAPAGAAV